MLKGNAIIGQSGGPTSVINASLAGVVDAASGSKAIKRVFGMRFGIEGVLQNFLLDLGAESKETLNGMQKKVDKNAEEAQIRRDADKKELNDNLIKIATFIGGVEQYMKKNNTGV